MAVRKVRCPQCGNLAEYRTDNPFRPFCSERCKLIDLGAWAEERYAIPGAPLEQDGLGTGSGEESPETRKRLDS